MERYTLMTAASTGLNVPAAGALDFLSLGALIHRLDPGVIPFRKAHTCEIHVSGGEFNTAANLADCFGLRTGVATAMVEYPIGELIAGRVRAMGVTPFYKMFKHDGVRGPNMATVYSDRGFGVRGPTVFYNRCNEAAAQLKPGDFDWEKIFGAGVRWFHSGGIFASLSESTSELIIEGMEAAHRHGAIVSLDLNYREKLWAAAGGLGARPQHVLRDDGERRQALPPHQGGGDDAAARALDQPPFLERGGVDQRPAARGADLRAGRLRPRRRRRRICQRPHLRDAERRAAGRVREARMGARRDDHRLPRRHHDGHARTGALVREGRIGEDSEVGSRGSSA